MKSTALALASILSITSAAWSAPITLTNDQLVEIVQHATDDPRTLKDLAGAHIVLDLRPSTAHPYFIAAGNVHGVAFICQTGFENFEGGPVTATVVRYEPGQDGRDHVMLDGCTGLER